jgi:hypothetical protein
MIAVEGTLGNDIRHLARLGCRALQSNPNSPNRPLIMNPFMNPSGLVAFPER